MIDARIDTRQTGAVRRMTIEHGSVLTGLNGGNAIAAPQCRGLLSESALDRVAKECNRQFRGSWPHCGGWLRAQTVKFCGLLRW